MIINLAKKLIKNHGSPLLVVDAERVRTQAAKLQEALPGVDLHYAVKAFPQVDVVSILHESGVKFDVASSNEIDLTTSRNVPINDLIHTHPIKTDKDIAYAIKKGCKTFVVDNVAELEKFERYNSEAEILIRISFRNENALIDLSKKFGCPYNKVNDLLDIALSKGIDVKGLSFHVGSQCKNSSKHAEAIHKCRKIFKEREYLSVLDIGGGFPAQYSNDKEVDINAFCFLIRYAIELLPEGIKVIAEPGRYLIAEAVQSISTVIGVSDREDRKWVYLDDGVYGSYSGQVYDHVIYDIEVQDKTTKEEITLAGPTCDSTDVIREKIVLPELNIYDIVIGTNMGAYTSASATHFNSIPPAKIVLIDAIK